MTLITENTQFFDILNQVVLKDIKKSFEEAHLDAKIYWISSATLWNSTTVTTLMCNSSKLTVMIGCTSGGGGVEIERAGFLVTKIKNDDFMAKSHLRVHFVVNNIGWQLNFAPFTTTSPWFKIVPSVGTWNLKWYICMSLHNHCLLDFSFSNKNFLLSSLKFFGDKLLEGLQFFCKFANFCIS